MKILHIALLFSLLCIALTAPSNATAQSTPGGGPNVEFDRPPKPAFKIEPVVHRFEASRGKTLPFEFEITSQGKKSTVEIRAIALRQDENGAILADLDSPPPEALRLESPERLELKEEEKAVIRGRLRVPLTNSNYHSFGILVKDLGSKVPVRAPADTPEKSRLSLNFVTQYILRCDVSVTNARGEDLRKLDLESAELIERNGLPFARAFISNPTDSPFEFSMTCRISKPGVASREKPFHLVQPTRSGRAEPERWTARILAHSRIRLEDFVPRPVFEGDYTMEIELLEGFRSRVSRTFAILVRPDDYPAQSIGSVQIAAGAVLSPSQVELSLLKGGDRYLALTLANNHKEELDFQLQPTDRDGAEVDWIRVRPTRVNVRSGSTRKVLIMMGRKRDADAHRYGFLNVNATPVGATADGEPAAAFNRLLPLAVMARVEEPVVLEADKLTFDGGASRPTFVVPVVNKGKIHVPLEAKMVVTDVRGHTLEIPAGFGRWLFPGDGSELRFRLQSMLKPGKYQIDVVISQGEGVEPMATRRMIDVDPPASSADGDDAANGAEAKPPLK